MNVRIARDGVEIGECDWEDLEQLVNEGQVLLTDHYWYEGMPDWRLLDDLVGVEESEPKPVARQLLSDWETASLPHRLQVPVDWDSGDPVTSPPVFRHPSIAAVAIGCGVAATGAIVLYLIVAFSNRRPDLPLPTAEATTVLERTDAAFRTKATNQLIAKLKELPTVAAQPSYTFYDSLTITILDPPAALSVMIRGTETTVSPETHEAISRTAFMLTADYRQDKWFFKSYHASTNDFIHGKTTETGRDDQYPIPPAIVLLLGLQVKRD